jgi:hypothetical protein
MPGEEGEGTTVAGGGGVARHIKDGGMTACSSWSSGEGLLSVGG